VTGAGLACLVLLAKLPVGFPPSSGYRLVKDWDFAAVIRDQETLRREFHTRYIYANGTLDHLNKEWSRYRDRDNHVFTENGLALVARVPTGSPAPGAVESGMLRSRWSGRYGVFEIRMKVPAGRGLWPAFWLNPQDQVWPPEIDVVEIVNNGRDTTRNSFHFLHPDAGPGPTKLGANHAYTPGDDYAEDFHVFSVEWTSERVRHFVDGVLIADRAFRWQHENGADGGPAHVLVNLAVGGKWPGPPRDTVFPARLDVAYIRVWQR
jgi:beta-glucanase (GH16 family)